MCKKRGDVSFLGPERSGARGLIEVVFMHGFRLGGIELGRWMEVVGEGFLGGLFCFPTGALKSASY